MARKRGGQPGNKNAKGHRGGNAYTAGARRATAGQQAARVASRAARVKAPLGARVRGSARGYALYARRNKGRIARSAAKGVLKAASATAIVVGLAASAGRR